MAIVLRKKKNGGISFQVKIKDPQGKWYPTPTFTHLDDAKKEEGRLLEFKRKGSKSFSDDARVVTVNDYWEVWSQENRSEVSDGWKISQDQMWRDYVKPVIGTLKMIDVGAPEIGRALNRAQERGLGSQTRKHIYSLMRRMFGDAVEYYEMLSANPVKPKFHRPKVGEQIRNFLMPAQVWVLLEYCRDSYLGPAIWIQTLAALRPSEVQALRGKSLLFDLDQILVCAAFNNKTGTLQDHPKQEDWAYSPMPLKLKEYLLERKVGPEAFVAPGPNGTMLSYETYIKAVKRACHKAGVPIVTPHELRHSCTEIYVQAGASTEDIRRLLNQKSLTATKRYIHRTDERLNQIAGRIGKPTLTVIEGSGNSSFPKNFPNWEKQAVCQFQEGVENVR